MARFPKALFRQNWFIYQQNFGQGSNPHYAAQCEHTSVNFPSWILATKVGCRSSKGYSKHLAWAWTQITTRDDALEFSQDEIHPSQTWFVISFHEWTFLRARKYLMYRFFFTRGLINACNFTPHSIYWHSTAKIDTRANFICAWPLDTLP